MTWSKAHVPEIGGSGHEATAEMVVPDTVDHDPGGEGVLRFGQPLGEGDAAIAFGCVWFHVKGSEHCVEGIQSFGGYDVPRGKMISAIHQPGGGGLLEGACVDLGSIRQGGGLLLDLL